MPKITFLPHETICPEGKVIEVTPGTTILDVALAHNIDIDHACEKSCSCTTCHVIIRHGFNSLTAPSDLENDMLDKAWGLEMESRLSCQTIVGEVDLTVEIPRYTLNLASERH